MQEKYDFLVNLSIFLNQGIPERFFTFSKDKSQMNLHSYNNKKFKNTNHVKLNLLDLEIIKR